MVETATTIPLVSGEDLRQLDGCHWRINGTDYVISSKSSGIDHRSMSGGSEARIVPLLDEAGNVARCLKTYIREVTPQRVRRIQWLADQRAWEWSPGLAGCPREWVDTRECGRPDGCQLDFAGYLMADVPGSTWAEFKLDVVSTKTTIHEEWRRRWISQLLRALVAMEKHNLVHGDLSPGNIMVSVDEPVTLSLIDFDSFVAPDAGQELAHPQGDDGGMIGTKGYMPIDLERPGVTGSALRPYSDRRARDMLLLELLCFDTWCPDEDPASEWDWSLIDEILGDRELGAAERYFLRPGIIDLPETRRVSSTALARAMGVSLPPAVRSRWQTSQSETSESGTAVEPSVGPWRWAVSSTVLAAQVYSAGKSTLWAISVAEWLLLGLIAPRLIIPATSGLWLIEVAIQLLVGAAIVAVGLWRTTALAFGESGPTVLQCGNIQLILPPSPVDRRSTPAWHLATLARMSVGILVLGGVIAILI